MSQVERITLDDTAYNIGHASAVQQRELLGMLAARGVYNAASSPNAIDVDFITGMLFAITDNDQFEKIAQIALSKTVQNGNDHIVTVEDFQGQQLSYYQLVAEAIHIQLKDFFSFLERSRTQEKESPTPEI